MAMIIKSPRTALAAVETAMQQFRPEGEFHGKLAGIQAELQEIQPPHGTRSFLPSRVIGTLQAMRTEIYRDISTGAKNHDHADAAIEMAQAQTLQDLEAELIKSQLFSFVVTAATAEKPIAHTTAVAMLQKRYKGEIAVYSMGKTSTNNLLTQTFKALDGSKISAELCTVIETEAEVIAAKIAAATYCQEYKIPHTPSRHTTKACEALKNVAAMIRESALISNEEPSLHASQERGI